MLIFIKKDIKLIMMWLLQECLPNRDAFLSLQNVMCGPGQLCSTTILELNDIFDTHFPFNIIASRCNLKIAEGHVAIVIKLSLILQAY